MPLKLHIPLKLQMPKPKSATRCAQLNKRNCARGRARRQEEATAQGSDPTTRNERPEINNQYADSTINHQGNQMPLHMEPMALPFYPTYTHNAPGDIDFTNATGTYAHQIGTYNNGMNTMTGGIRYINHNPSHFYPSLPQRPPQWHYPPSAVHTPWPSNIPHQLNPNQRHHDLVRTHTPMEIRPSMSNRHVHAHTHQAIVQGHYPPYISPTAHSQGSPNIAHWPSARPSTYIPPNTNATEQPTRPIAKGLHSESANRSLKRPRDISVQDTLGSQLRPFKIHKGEEITVSGKSSSGKQAGEKKTETWNIHHANAPPKVKNPLGHERRTVEHTKISHKRQEKIQQFALADYFTKQKAQQSKRNNEYAENIGTVPKESDREKKGENLKQSSTPTELDKVHANIASDIAQGPSRAAPSSLALRHDIPIVIDDSISENTGLNQQQTSKTERVLKPVHLRNRVTDLPLSPSRKARMREYSKFKRTSASYKSFERQTQKIVYQMKTSREPSRMEKLIAKFREEVQKGPEYICIACNRMLYRFTVRSAAAVLALKTEVSELCTTQMGSQKITEWICFTCHNHIQKGKVPPMSLANGLAFPTKPKKMVLHSLEWRLLSPRLVFMKIHQAPRGKQFKIEGNVVNVISKMANAVNMLPRKPSDTDTIPVKLKRRLKYSHHAMSQNIRPNMVRKGAKWLVKHGPLFAAEGIKFTDRTFVNVPVEAESDDPDSTDRVDETPLTPSEDGRDRLRFRCLVKKCTTVLSSYPLAQDHLRIAHHGHVPAEETATCSSFKKHLIIGQTFCQDAVHHSYYCEICEMDFMDHDHPRDHMFTEHGLLELADALQYHTDLNRPCNIHTYKLYDANQVALIRKNKKKAIPFPVWAIEIKALNITELKNWSNNMEGCSVGEWTLEKLPHNNCLSTMLNGLRQRTIAKDAGKLASALAHDTEDDSDEEPTGATDTMLTDQSYVEQPEFQAILNLAPGEGNKPKSIFLDKYSEELAYPDIFLGHSRPEPAHVHVQYSDIVKSELTQVDRRAALNVENIFFKAKKLQMKLITSRTQIALRQHKTSDMTISAGTLKNPDSVKSIIQHDQGYQFLQTLRGSPPYFRRAKQDLFAMIRQLGPATFFMSLSAAETKWTHLLKILGKAVDKVDYTDEDIQIMRWEEKCRLVQSDPITCARHFDYMLRTLISKFLKSPEAPIGTLEEYFYRVEMQHRGSCHVHMVVWIAGAPKLENATFDEITTFVDKYITCAKAPANNTEKIELVSRQKHTHTGTCKKNSHSRCRFNYPQPPFPETTILDPLPEDDPRFNELSAKWTAIHNELEKMSKGTDCTFAEFLEHLDLTYDDYKLCIQTSLRARTMFLKRTVHELSINNYNDSIMLAWQANMDIQYVIDAYACATYIVLYLAKGCRGMSKILVRASQEARSGNSSIMESMRHIGNQFLNSVEISAQEAAYLTLQMALRKSSRSTVFINTAPPAERVRLLKKQTDLEAMDDNDTDIDSSNLMARYANRGAALEKTCLAEWAAWYDTIVKKKKKDDIRIDVDGTPVQDLDALQDDDEEDLEIDCDTGTSGDLKRRRKARVIRCPWFNVHEKEDLHYRELIVLFIPWRNEKEDLLGGFNSHQEHYLAQQEAINNLLEEYSPGRKAVEEALALQAAESLAARNNPAVAPCTQHNDEQDQAKKTKTNDPTLKPKYDIAHDIGLSIAPGVALSQLNHNQLPDQLFRAGVKKLNPEQKTFFDYIMRECRENSNQIFAFLSGGAGVGKSHLSSAIYQQLLRIYNTTAGEDHEHLRILVMAPTGKAAHIMQGMTIHSALRLPFNRIGQTYIPLSISTLTTLRAELAGLKFVMIDEISMVGNNLFNYVDRRLQDIMGLNKPFGGVHMLCIGDLFQLRPIFDPWIFEMPSEGIRALATNTWQENFKLYELTTIMRQKDFKPFAELLNRLREGKQTAADKAFLKSKVIKHDYHKPDYPYKKVPHLFATNAAVADFNLAARKNTPTRILADDHLNGTCSEEMARIFMQRMGEKKAKDAQGLETVLIIAIDDRIEVAQNLDVKDGLTNGAAGKVMKLPKPSDGTNSMLPDGTIWILFDDTHVGADTRARGKRLYNKDIDKGWTPIQPVMKNLQVSANTQITEHSFLFAYQLVKPFTDHKDKH